MQIVQKLLSAIDLQFHQKDAELVGGVV